VISLGKGFFITLEGGEGAGKSTQQARIVAWLQGHSKEVVETREPGGTVVSEQIRQLLLDTRNAGLDSRAELLLMFAARTQLLQQVIRPALAAGKVVVSDRFTDASYAYQGGGRQMGADTVAVMENFVHHDLQPDLTLLFDVPIEQGMQRVAGRGAADRFETESIKFFERVRSTYLERAAEFPERFSIIDAGQGQEQVWQQVQDVLEQNFMEWVPGL
jgi:dTMP kinase